MNSFEKIGEPILNSSFWLPPKTNSDWQRFPQAADLFYAWKFVPLLLVIKYVGERHIFVKLGTWTGIKEKLREKPPTIDLLEEAHRLKPNGKWKDQELTALSKRLDLPKKHIVEWFRAKKNFGKPTTLEKFCESSWRTLFFVCIFTYGLYAHWTKEWFWDFKLCWKNFPQPVAEDLYWYYIISLANYSSWSISHFWDVQRKDPRIMMFHHFVTLTLLIVAWIAQFHRVGLIVCLLHDVGDFWLELSKCLKYIGLKFTCQIMFILFTIAWITTRNIIFPFYLIPSTYYHSPHNVSQSFPFSCFHGPCDSSSFRFTSSHVLILVATSLSILHVYWTCLILKVLYLALFVGKLEDDTVSSDDDDDD